MEIPNNLAIKAGDIVYFGGTAPVDKNGEIVKKDDVQAQTRRIFSRIEEKLKKANMNLENLSFVTVYLSDLNLYQGMNEVYAEVMPKEFPARKVIEAPMTIDGMVVEMTAIANSNKKEVL